MATVVKRLARPSSPSARYHVQITSKTNPTSVYSAVSLCLINANATGLLYRVAPYPIPFTKYTPVKVEFEGPDIGEVDRIMVSPESGELEVSMVALVIASMPPPSETTLDSYAIPDNKIIEFVPSHEHNVFVPKRAFCPLRKAEADAEYERLKHNIHTRALVYAGIGTGFTAVSLGPTDAYAFAVGVGLASMYNIMLQLETDNIGKPRQKIDSATRLVTLFSVSSIIINHYSTSIQHHNMYYIAGFLGFLTYKMSIMRSMW